jgi:ABC-type amino acid transport substrate-binding protein
MLAGCFCPDRSRYTLGVFVGGVFLVAALGRLSLAEEQAPLRVCVLQDNLPYSSRLGESGFDLDTARAVAAGLQRPLVPVWIENSRYIDELGESDLPLRQLSRNECDAIFSVPGPEAVKDAPKLALGRPYYGAAFELLGRDGGVPSRLAALKEKPVAVQAQTIANFVLHAQKVPVRTFFSVEAALAGVVQGEAEAALVWGPTAGWYLRTHPDMPLVFVPGYKPPAVVCWNEHVATRKSDAALREAIDTVLAQLSADGTLRTLMDRYGLPFHPPFDSTYSLAEMYKIQQ